MAHKKLQMPIATLLSSVKPFFYEVSELLGSKLEVLGIHSSVTCFRGIDVFILFERREYGFCHA